VRPRLGPSWFRSRLRRRPHTRATRGRRVTARAPRLTWRWRGAGSSRRGRPAPRIGAQTGAAACRPAAAPPARRQPLWAGRPALVARRWLEGDMRTRGMLGRIRPIDGDRWLQPRGQSLPFVRGGRCSKPDTLRTCGGEMSMRVPVMDPPSLFSSCPNESSLASSSSSSSKVRGALGPCSWAWRRASVDGVAAVDQQGSTSEGGSAAAASRRSAPSAQQYPSQPAVELTVSRKGSCCCRRRRCCCCGR
jgi:hypothetical protein